jgi:hypothetical protein
MIDLIIFFLVFMLEGGKGGTVIVKREIINKKLSYFF